MMEIDELLMLIEKNKFTLSKLDEDFYEKARLKIQELEEQKKNAEESEAARLEDIIRSYKKFLRKVFEIRTGRIINAAWAEVCGQPLGEDMENMTKKERDIFQKIVEVIRDYKKEILEGRKVEKSEYLLVRIKRDVEIQGVDGKTYKLRKEDIVTLPALNADALIKGGFAEKIEVKTDEVS
ncbi:MAG: hypothetical protein QFX40_00305 [Archaeoglobales archaeon]|nr:hypothetical protein [Archaeoglobales archaeon]